jgi:hypothetical protein
VLSRGGKVALLSVPDHEQITVTNRRSAVCSRMVEVKETCQPEKRKVDSSILSLTTRSVVR